MLLPVDLRDWVPEDDLVHFIIEAVEGMDLTRFRINHRGSGSEQYPPAMMLSLLIYCYACGTFTSRRIESATRRDVAVRYLTGDTHPDHDTIAVFRRRNFDAVAECFVRVLELARETGVLKVGTVSVDGTHLRANASKHRNVTYGRAGELVDQLREEVKGLLQQAETADQKDESSGQQLPEELRRRETLKAKLDAARKRLEERARVRAEAEREEFDRKVREREGRKGRRKGKIIQPPNPQPGPREQDNLVDADSRLMRKSKRSSYEQCYNAQAVVDAEGSQLVVAARVSQCASDRNELATDVQAVPQSAGSVVKVVADSGYACEAQVQRLEKQNLDVYVSTGAECRHLRRKHDFRPAHRRSESSKEPKAEWLVKMKAKLESEAGRTVYALRKKTVEPVFGVIKHAMGFRQFLLRGLANVEGEWNLVVLAYNFKRLWALQPATA